MKDDVGFMTKTIKMNKDVTKTIYLFIIIGTWLLVFVAKCIP